MDEINQGEDFGEFVVLDHEDLGDERGFSRLTEQAARVRELSLKETTVTSTGREFSWSGVEALFAPNFAWTELERLSIIDCGSLSETIQRLTTSPWIVALRTLVLEAGGPPLSRADLATLTTAPWFQDLRLVQLDASIADWFTVATGRVLSCLSELSLTQGGLEAKQLEESLLLLKASAPTLYPALRRFTLVVYDPDALPLPMRPALSGNEEVSFSLTPAFEVLLSPGNTRP
ncbi:MAG: hypothetical protein Q8N23_05890 [Archangium sp.]|nr:hypothetical protein [Archangium sp.]MDP3152181.1 hypothetical protein [Archangium sp.]MDP3574937.1 hypothetical protein [Archangium sp.]